MDHYKDNHEYKNNMGQDRITNIASKVLMPLGLFLIAIISFLTSATEVPAWAYWVMVIYLVTAFVIILILLTKSIIPNIVNWFSQRKFAKKKRLELQELSNGLNKLLESDRTTTIPYFLSHLSSKLSAEVNLLNCLHRNNQQFTILQSWALTLSDNIIYNNHKLFLRDVDQFSKLVNRFTWSCLWVQQFLNSNDVREKLTKEIVLDWNTAAQKVSELTSRVQRIMESINKKYNTNRCIEHFEDVKTL